MKRLIAIIIATLLLSAIPMAAVAEYDESLVTVASFGIPIVVTIRFYITYYGGPLDPDGNGTTYLAGTEPDYIVHDDGTWEIIPSQ